MLPGELGSLGWGPDSLAAVCRGRRGSLGGEDWREGTGVVPVGEPLLPALLPPLPGLCSRACRVRRRSNSLAAGQGWGPRAQCACVGQEHDALHHHARVRARVLLLIQHKQLIQALQRGSEQASGSCKTRSKQSVQTSLGLFTSMACDAVQRATTGHATQGHPATAARHRPAVFEGGRGWGCRHPTQATTWPLLGGAGMGVQKQVDSRQGTLLVQQSCVLQV